MGIVVEGHVGYVTLDGLNLCHGWGVTEDEYGIRPVPALVAEVEQWIDEHVHGRYVLRACDDDHDGPILAHEIFEDRIYFFDVVDYTLFKMRWVG